MWLRMEWGRMRIDWRIVTAGNSLQHKRVRKSPGNAGRKFSMLPCD